MTDADGKLKLNFVPAGSGSYVLTVRTTGSQISSPAFTFVAGESEIFWADGASASSPVNGSDSYTGVLSLTNAAQTVLSGRRVDVTYAGGEDANFGTQTAPAVRDSANTAHSTTGTDGTFTVSLTDVVATPPNPETGTLTATAPALKGAGDVPAADATDELEVNFEEAPVVKAVTLTKKNVFAGALPRASRSSSMSSSRARAPTPLPGDDVVLKDYPVSFTVDKGFLTPDSKGRVSPRAINDLMLTADQDDEGDLFGFYEDLGTDQSVDTSDDQGANNAAGIIATIGKDAGFNDDGLVTQTVTVTAGGKTATDDDHLRRARLPEPGWPWRSARTAAPPTCPARSTSSSTRLTSSATSWATSPRASRTTRRSPGSPPSPVAPRPTSSTTTRRSRRPRASRSRRPSRRAINADENLVNATGDKAAETSEVVKGNTTSAGATVVAATRTRIIAKLKGINNGGKADRLNVVAPKKANGATVKLFRSSSARGCVPSAPRCSRTAERSSSSPTATVATSRSTSPRSVRPTTPRARSTNRRNVR